jgi:hypothetical protein
VSGEFSTNRNTAQSSMIKSCMNHDVVDKHREVGIARGIGVMS